MTDLTPETLAEWREEAGYGSVALDADDVLALLDALAEQQRIRVEITRTLVNPANCKVWRDGVLVFDGVSLDALAAEKAAREAAEARADKAEAHTNHQRARFAWHRVDLGESVRAAEARVAELEAELADAIPALLAYAASCEADYPGLAADLRALAEREGRSDG